MDKNDIIPCNKYKKQINMLANEQAGVLFKALLAFQDGEDIPEMDTATDIIFSFIIDDLGSSSTKKEKSAATKTKRTRFIQPSVEEVRAYCKERGNNINAETFVDFYQSKGWKVGNNPMKDWKACVRTWEKKDQQKQKNKFNNFEGRRYDTGSLERQLLGAS